MISNIETSKGVRTIKHYDWVKQHQEQIEETYNHLHSIAEVSFQELETTKFICEEIEKLKIPYTTFSDHTGLVATWVGDKKGPVVGVRADLDALWQNVDGIYHSCGHDAHVTMVLYAIKMLKN